MTRNGNCTTDFGLFFLAIELAHHGQMIQDLAPGFGFKNLQLRIKAKFNMYDVCKSLSIYGKSSVN